MECSQGEGIYDGSGGACGRKIRNGRILKQKEAKEAKGGGEI
jgi:hypothetical protein